MGAFTTAAIFCYAVEPAFVFLNLLEADAKFFSELRLREPLLHASHADAPTDFSINLAKSSL